MPSLKDRIKALINVFDEREKYKETQKEYRTWSDEDLEMAGDSNPWHLGIKAERARRKRLKESK